MTVNQIIKGNVVHSIVSSIGLWSLKVMGEKT
jgi:hypothetical protein